MRSYLRALIYINLVISGTEIFPMYLLFIYMISFEMCFSRACLFLGGLVIGVSTSLAYFAY